MSSAQLFDKYQALIKQDPRNIGEINRSGLSGKDFTVLCSQAIIAEPTVFFLCKAQNKFIAQLAVQGCLANFRYVKPEFQTYDLCIYVLRRDPHMITLIANPLPYYYSLAVEEDGTVYRIIEEKLDTEQKVSLKILAQSNPNPLKRLGLEMEDFEDLCDTEEDDGFIII